MRSGWNGKNSASGKRRTCTGGTGAIRTGSSLAESGTRAYVVIMDVGTQAVVSSLKLRAIGNSVGVILPKELLTRLNLNEGDTVYAVDMPDGIRLTRSNPLLE